MQVPWIYDKSVVTDIIIKSEPMFWKSHWGKRYNNRTHSTTFPCFLINILIIINLKFFLPWYMKHFLLIWMYPGLHEHKPWSQTFANCVPLHCQSNPHIPPMLTFTDWIKSNKTIASNISYILQGEFIEICVWFLWSQWNFSHFFHLHVNCEKWFISQTDLV